MIRLGLIDYEQLSKRELTYQQFDSLGLLDKAVTAGVRVSHATANQIAAYWNGITVIAQMVGMLDRHLYRRVGDDDRERATTHPAYALVHDRPNPYATGMQFWTSLVGSAVSWGNGYAEIEFDRALRPVALWNIPSEWMEPRVEVVQDPDGVPSTRVWYLYRGTRRVEAEDVLHVPGMGFDGVRGYSPVRLARESLGLTIAMERFGAALFGSGGWPGVALEYPGELSEKARERLKEDFEAKFRGPEKAHRAIVLEEGMKVSKPITVPPDDAQFLESRAFQIEEIARWLNISPYWLKSGYGKWPGGTPENALIQLQIETIMPWTTRVEQECDRKLVARSQRGTYYTEHNYDKMLKADSKTRMENWRTLVELGVVNPSLVARRENLPRPGIRGTTPAAPEPPPEPQTSPPAGPVEPVPAEASRPEVLTSFRALLLEIVGRFAKREAFHAGRAAKKGGKAFAGWLEEFYGPDEETVLRESLLSAVGFGAAALRSKADADEVAGHAAAGYIETSRKELEELPTVKVGELVPRLLGRWQVSRPAACVDEIVAAITAGEMP